MPLSVRGTRQDGSDKERSVKSQEQELKRARGAISCAECRRLKLKCDKTVPCSSCKRRGCASICPNGSLTTGQGTRFILADTDRLHRKIAVMSDRIRQLEDGLAILQSSVTREPHPLLSNDLLKVKSGLELHSAAEGVGGGEALGERDGEAEEDPGGVDSFGTLAVRDDGAATFYGRSAGSESLLLDDKPLLPVSTLSRTSSSHHLDLHPEVNRLASTFPHGPPDLPVYDLQDIITGYLPPWPRAAQLRALYLEQAPWFFGAVTERQLFEEIFPAFYEEAAEEVRARAALGASAEAFNLPITGKTTHSSAHELALMLVVFCYGALTDPNLPPAPHNIEAERYYQLTRAALSLEPVMDRPPSIATVQVLSLMGIYQGMVADEHSIESTWSLMGLASKLAQSTGLHLDCSRFQLSAAQTQKRRSLCPELFITDCWQALATGRLPSFELQYVDTELPADPDESLADDGTPQPSFPAWKAQWGKECVSGVVMGTLTAKPPKYALVLDLDRRIRDMALPKYAQGPPPPGAGLAQTMSHYMPTNYLHLTLLYVHRVFFAQAVTDHPSDPMRSPYAPSFLAGYRSASALLVSLREQFSLFPMQIARFWVLWTHAFSACVMLGSVVTRGGTTKTAQAALGELRVACDLFERAAEHGGRATKFVPPLRRLFEKAQAAYFQGSQPLRRDIFTPRSAENEQDELSIFSGRTARTVATKSNRPPRISPSASSNTTSSGVTPPAMSSPSESQNGSDLNRRVSHSPPSANDVFPGLEASYRTAVHPNLVAELSTFEGQLEQQISHSNAYYAGHQLQTQQPPVYGEQQQQYVEQAQPQPQAPQQQQMSWYQMNTPVEYQTHSQSRSPPSNTQSPQQQQQQQQQQPYPAQYETQYSAHYGTQQHVPEQQQAHPDAYHHHQTQTGVVPAQTQDYPNYPQGVPQPVPTNGRTHSNPIANLHDLPVYGGAYSKPPSANGANSSSSQQYQDHPYAQIVVSQAHAPAYDYSTYANHSRRDSQSVARSELWAANVPPSSDEELSYQTSPVYDASLRMEEHISSTQNHNHTHHAHSQSQAQAQAQAHTHAHTHAQAQYRPHQAVNVTVTPPQPLQPQHTGQGHAHPQAPAANQSHYQHAQNHHYGYDQQQQQQMMATPQGGYSLQETWTSFFQQELPGPPARR